GRAPGRGPARPDRDLEGAAAAHHHLAVRAHPGAQPRARARAGAPDRGAAARPARVALWALQLPRPPASRGRDPPRGQPDAVRQLQAHPLPGSGAGVSPERAGEAGPGAAPGAPEADPAARLAAIVARIAQAARASGRDPAEIVLVGASKLQPAAHLAA